MFSLKRREIFRQQVTFNIILAVLAIVVAFPIFWTICSSFKTIQEIYTLNPKILPKSLDFVNYKFLFETSVIDYKTGYINMYS